MITWSKENQIELTTSYGLARSIDHPGTGIFDLAKIADRKMYEAKVEYYQRNGKERRKQSDRT